MRMGTGGNFLIASVALGPWLLLAGVALPAHADHAVVLHVSTNGNAAWSGRLPKPNAAKTDGPLASLAGARESLFALDALNTLLSMLAICALYVGALYLILHRHTVAAFCFAAVVVLGATPYFAWCKHLPPPARARTEPRATGEPAVVLREIPS